MEILVCGDSHCNVFNYINKKQDKLIFDVCLVGGATAQGCVNPNSKTDALKIFKDKINKNISCKKIMIMLGEVDCGFLVWVRSKKLNISVNEQLNNSINNLFKFINENVKKKFNNVDIIIIGSILPTIKDSTDKNFLNGARSEVDVNQFERTKTTLEYNLQLKNICDKNGYKYIDITEYIINDNGVVKDYYLNNNPYNHHLDNEKTYKLWLKKIYNII